ncbi:MAG: MFS transporter [Anaerolineales bacterium]|nr:MAG: MFS transporter [Anaerolineales bacterium]
METKKGPLLSPIMRWFMFAMILANISSTMSFGFMSLYLADMGAGVSDIGFIFTVTSLVPLVLQIVGGWISDSIGRLKTIALGSVAGLIGGVGFWLAPNWEWVMISLGVTFIAVSMVSPSFSSFIADQTPEENRGKVFGITNSLFQVVGIIGPILGGYLAQNYSYKRMYFVAIILYASAAVLRFWMATSVTFKTEPKSEELTIKSLKTSLKTMVGLLTAGGIITWIFISDGASDIAFRLTSSLSPIYTQDIGGISVQQIGFLDAINSSVLVLLNIPGGWIADKYGERVGISIGFLMFPLAFLTFLPATTFSRYAVAWVIFAIGGSLLGPAYNSLISKAVPEKISGTAFGFFQSTLGVISLPAPWIGAQLWERFSPQTPFYLTAIFSALIGVFCWFKLALPKNDNEEAQAAGEVASTD